MIILYYYAPAYQTDSNICKFINKKWMNPHVTDVHIQQKKVLISTLRHGLQRQHTPRVIIRVYIHE